MQHAHRFRLINSLMRQIPETWAMHHYFSTPIQTIYQTNITITLCLSRDSLHFPGRSRRRRTSSLCLEVWWQDQHRRASRLSCSSFHRDPNWSADDVNMCTMLGVTIVIVISRKNKRGTTGAPEGGNQKMTTWPRCLQPAPRRVMAWHTRRKPSLLPWESQYSSHYLHYADSLLCVG